MDDLKNKIDHVKNEHAAEIVEARAVKHDEQSRDEAMFMLGRIWQNDHIAEAIESNLKAQTILALERFQRDKRYLSLGYDTFDDFLNNCPESKLSKRQYYDRLALIRDQGPEIYDLLTSVGISVRTQKLLGKGDLSIKGDRLMVGDQEVEIANTGVIKDVLNELFDEKRQLQKDLAKAEIKNEKLTEQIDQGQRDFDELQRNLDALRQSNPYERALARAVNGLLELTEMIGQLPDAQKAKRGKDGMPFLWSAIRQVKTSYGTNFNFDDAAATPATDLDAIAAEVLANEDDED